jgi:lipoprotein-releasing system permease protein
MFVVSIATMALIVILSVFNGLEDLLRSLYSSFDPELKIEYAQGKSFVLSDSLLIQIESINGVQEVVKVIEDNVYVKYNNAEQVVVLKGVSKNYLTVNKLQNKITEGEMRLWGGDVPYAVVGQGVQFGLGVTPANDFFSLQVFYPKNLRSTSLDPTRALNRKNIHVAGVFAIERQFDEKYVLVPIEFAAELLSYNNKVTSLEITTSGGSPDEVQAKLQEVLGSGFKVLNEDEQHAVMLRTVKIEKLFVFLTFTFIIGVSSINIFFALSMLAIDKKKDVSMLFSMGATEQQIRRIFLSEGGIISLTGALFGLLLGFGLCYLQQEVGLVAMGLETSVVNFYPVKMEWQDFATTGISIIVITFLVSFRPAYMAAKFTGVELL